MPQAFLTFFGLVTGYLNGAGLGALFFSFYPGAEAQPELVALTAALILGPAARSPASSRRAPGRSASSRLINSPTKGQNDSPVIWLQ